MSRSNGRDTTAPRAVPVISENPIEPCLIAPIEPHYLGPCAKGCGGMIIATAAMNHGRVERRQYCSNEDCNGRIPSLIEGIRNRQSPSQGNASLPDLSPPNYLDGTKTGNDLDPPDPASLEL